MSAITNPLSETSRAWKLPYRGNAGMACLIFAESVIFMIFVVAYLFYVGKSPTVPTPREVLETPIFYLVVTHNRSRRPLLVRHRPRMASLDLRTRADHFHEPFWNHVLLAGWTARHARDRRTGHAKHCAGFRDRRPSWPGAVRSHRCALPVLAFRGCRVGRCFHRC